MQTKGDLIRHIRISHVEQPVVQIDETVIYKCSVCSNTFESKNDIRNHQKNSICPHTPENPLLHNDNTSNNNGNRQHENCQCRHGMSCRFLRDNRCNFYHAVSEQPQASENNEQWQQVNNNRRQNRYNPQSRSSSTGVNWCRFVNRCNKGRFCSYRHYELDFPLLSVRSRQ